MGQRFEDAFPEYGSPKKPPKSATGFGAGQTSLDLGKRLRDEGIERVVSNAPSWIDAAKQIFTLKRLSIIGQHMTGEDVRLLLTASGLPEPHHPHAWGAMISGLVREGALTPTDQYTQSKQPKAHARKVVLYIVN